MELIADVLTKQHQVCSIIPFPLPSKNHIHPNLTSSKKAQPTTKFLLNLSSHRTSLPSTPSSSSPSTNRSLYTVVTHSSPYVYALIEDPASSSQGTDQQKDTNRQVMLSLTPPASLHQLLGAVKSGFVVPSAADGGKQQRAEGVSFF